MLPYIQDVAGVKVLPVHLKPRTSPSEADTLDFIESWRTLALLQAKVGVLGQ